MMPILQTERLILRPFRREDAADVFAYACNPNVSRFTTWQTHGSVADAEAYIEMVLGRQEDEQTWAICLREEGRAIGAIEFGVKGGGVAEFHYVLREESWNKGLMTEAARAVLAWGFENYPEVNRVVTRALTENVASQRVMAKCGLKFEKVRVEVWKKVGREVEQSEYGMSRAEWSRLAAGQAE